MKYAFGWQGYLYKKGNEMETKRQVRKEGILSEFFDGKWNCTGGEFLNSKRPPVGWQSSYQRVQLCKERRNLSVQCEGTNGMKDDVDGKWRSLVGS